MMGCLAALAPVGTSQTATFAQPLYGTWYTFPLGNPDTDSVRHEFRHNATTGKDEIVVTRLCPGDYRAVIARVVSPIEVSESAIKVLRRGTDTEKGELNSVCQISLEAGTWNYTISGDGERLSIADPGGVPDLLELARQDAVSEAALPATLYGTWVFPVHQENGAKVQIKLIFFSKGDSERGKVRQIATCSKANNTLLSQVDSPISVTKDQLTILESSSHEQRDGPFICRATITAGMLHYVVSPNGATMTLLKTGGQPLVLTREP